MGAPITVVDVETTGLANEDRVVSLGVLQVDNLNQLHSNGTLEAKGTYLVFNPGRPSHPRARKVHGYDDEFLALQDSFAAHAEQLRPYFEQGTVVAHNASFDERFIRREFEAIGAPLKQSNFHCTMLEHRRRHGSPSGLDAVLSQIGYPARTGRHGALQDAWYALAVYCWLMGLPTPSISSLPGAEPQNIRSGRRPTQTTSAVPAAPKVVMDDALLQSARKRIFPIATVMMAVAAADDEVFGAEVESISLLIDTMLAGTPAGADSTIGGRLLEQLADLRPGETEIAAACDAIVADRHMQSAVTSWIRQVTYADGNASHIEANAVMNIATQLREAHGRRRALLSTS